jgi:hypothetical protein
MPSTLAPNSRRHGLAPRTASSLAQMISAIVAITPSTVSVAPRTNHRSGVAMIHTVSGMFGNCMITIRPVPRSRNSQFSAEPTRTAMDQSNPTADPVRSRCHAHDGPEAVTAMGIRAVDLQPVSKSRARLDDSPQVRADRRSRSVVEP